MESALRSFFTYLEESRSECLEREKQLILDERRDEANLCRVRANIYDIYRTLLQTSVERAAKENWDFEGICRSFEEKAKRVPQNWKSSYETAKQHQDAARILVEGEKLAAASEIMVQFTAQKEDME